ncbi:MAG: cyclic nucleotide-binding domain-containing protein [Fibrobacter sp.]|nr:cyclic nucleotide-binding domain-containing protein [Fibrobacter sp.]
MYKLPIVTSDSALVERTEEYLSKNGLHQIVLHQLSDSSSTLDYLGIEMPELIIVNFSDKGINAFELLTNIMSDAWLLHGGIIAICDSNNEIERVELIKGANLIIALDTADYQCYIAKVVAIILNNRRILFQRELSSDFLNNISGAFELDNDIYDVKCYVNLICNFLYNSNRIKMEQKFNVRLALTEMLTNAIEHGNCGVTYDEKSEWLEKSLDIAELIALKNREEAINRKKVSFEYTITPEMAIFTIGDQGNGFDWRHVRDVTKDEFILELHGRGILITKSLVHNLRYNEKGNEVTFEVHFERERTVLMPGLFEFIPAKEIKGGDVIFNEGEPGDYLYYIVKGIYNVVVQGEVVSTLTPDDIFMGEMSFLLNNERNATIIAATDGKLIEISKKSFIEAIREKPHYALFLCRLLAQRIQRANNGNVGGMVGSRQTEARSQNSEAGIQNMETEYCRDLR